MKKITLTSEMQHFAEEVRRSGKKISFVPTMGALHEGHLALVREGKKRGDVVVVSIFVNPTQFNDPSDFKKYPRTLDDDLKKCERERVDVVFSPTVEEIYPSDKPAKKIALPQVAFPLEGRSRPGHFQGVVQVVYRLFEIVQPHAAIFGMKDYQQLRVIQEMVKQEKLGVKIVSFPTVRTPEGLAMSSRNERLSEQGRKQALALYRSLQEVQRMFREGERSALNLQKKAQDMLFQEPGLRVDSVDIVDAISLKSIRKIEKIALVALAGFVEEVRLIDNCLLTQNKSTNLATKDIPKR